MLASVPGEQKFTGTCKLECKVDVDGKRVMKLIRLRRSARSKEVCLHHSAVNFLTGCDVCWSNVYCFNFLWCVEEDKYFKSDGFEW